MSVISRLILSTCVFIFAIFQASSAQADSGIDCSLITDEISTPVLIGLDDLLVPIPAPYDAGGMCYKADFDGDGIDEYLVQGFTSSDQTIILKQTSVGKYGSVHQRWDNNHLGLDWSANNVSLYVDDYNNDSRADIILDSNQVGGTSGLIYAEGNGSFEKLIVAWDSFANAGSNETIVAGALSGKYAVSNTGAATFSIPIQIPPGIAGVNPNLTIEYNSQSGNGLLGLGWSVSGLSSITRCPSTLVQEIGIDYSKPYAGINLNSNDRFCLDGQFLVSVRP